MLDIKKINKIYIKIELYLSEVGKKNNFENHTCWEVIIKHIFIRMDYECYL